VTGTGTQADGAASHPKRRAGDAGTGQGAEVANPEGEQARGERGERGRRGREREKEREGGRER
jgi:hypothetical protein